MFSNRLSNLSDKISRIRGRQQAFEQEKEQAETRLQNLISALEVAEKALVLIQQVAKKTQQELEYQLSELTSLSLQSIFSDPYELKIVFEIKRGRTEAQISFTKNGQEFDPMEATGGGAVDVAAFGLRLSCSNLIRPALRRVLLMDEPFKNLSEIYQPRAGALFRELAAKMKLQIIMVTHNENLIEGADRIFRVQLRGGKSVVECTG